MTCKKISPFMMTFIVSAVFIALVRALINFSTPLVPGTNGAYYLVQARSVMQTGSLAFADTPLIFWLEGALAWIINLFAKDVNLSVASSVKLLDCILPALAGLPVALVLARKMKDVKPFSGISTVLLCSLHIFGLMMVSELQKNALGNVLLLFTLCYLYLAIEDKKISYWVLGSAFFILTALAHIGSFAVLVVLLSVFLLTHVVVNFRNILKKWLFPVIGCLLLIAVFVLLPTLMPGKFSFLTKLSQMPGKLFSNSWINSAFAFLSAPGARFPVMEFLSIALNHLIAMFALVNLIKTWGQKNNAMKAVYISLIFTVILFSSPLLGQEYAQRLFMVSYIPAIVLAMVHVLDTQTRVSAMPSTVAMAIFSAISLLSIIQFRPTPAITMSQYNDLSSFGKKIESQKAIVVAKHGLEWWTAWTTGKPILQQYHVEPTIWDEYQDVYYLKVSGETEVNHFASQTFTEVEIPKDSKEFFTSQSIQAFQVITPQNNAQYGIPDTKGIIIDVSKKGLLLMTPQGRIFVRIGSDAVIESDAKIEVGSNVQVWGKKTLILSDIIAGKIAKDPNPLPPPSRTQDKP